MQIAVNERDFKLISEEVPMKAYFLWLAKLLTLVVVFCVIVPAVLVGVVASTESGIESEDSSDKPGVSVIELSGIIQDSKETLKRLYKDIEKDNVIGVVLRVDSPGGAVAPSQEIYAAVAKLKAKKPIVVSMGTLAASGGLYASLGASKVFAQPGTLTGSIGVILQVPNVSKITEKYGFEMVTIKAGELKDAGNSFRPMLDSERAYLESTVAEAHRDFKQAVVDGRNLQMEEVEKFADGRIILGSQAVAYGLVDAMGDIHDAAKSVHELAGKPLAEGEMPHLLYKSDKFEELRKILQSFTPLLPGAVFGSQVRLQYLMH